MAETLLFVIAMLGTIYFLYWFWKNDDGLADWDKKPNDFNKPNEDH